MLLGARLCVDRVTFRLYDGNDETGKHSLLDVHPRRPALRMPVPSENDGDWEIVLEMQRRYELDKSDD